MKIFVYLCGLLPLFQEGISYISESNLYHYIDMNSRIREVIENVTSFIVTANHNAQLLADEFHEDITTLEGNYGRDMYKKFQEKYEAKAIEFSKNPKLSEDCSEFIANLLEHNQEHQTELTELIAKATDTWRIGFNNLYYKDSTTSTVLANMEKEAYECGILFDGDDATAPFNCALKVLDRVRRVEAEAVPGVFEEIPNLIKRKKNTLMALDQSLTDKFIPSFYDEDQINSWLEKYCSGQYTDTFTDQDNGYDGVNNGVR